eukprot:TRINITY_DN53313_c0_g1_i1.p1 TRINITY_DN53313_c0_g1~~TRINITY_DN53313_c0_g1_i1.p1  ORF type:complete len:707 (-),score=149.56 TRINITY_DN53313_c0_g1_i1:37-2157(-)
MRSSCRPAGRPATSALLRWQPLEHSSPEISTQPARSFEPGLQSSAAPGRQLLALLPGLAWGLAARGRPRSYASSVSARRCLTQEGLVSTEAELRLTRLRQLMSQNKVHAYIVPSDDPHLSEIPPDCFARRKFLSGFTGSAGTALVTASSALLWTDGRYFIQAEQELTDAWTLMKSGVKGTHTIDEWLKTNLDKSSTVGIDPNVYAASAALEMKEALKQADIELTCLEDNLVDAVWAANQPRLPQAPVRIHPAEFAGATVQEKLAAVRLEMQNERADSLVVSALDEVAYLFNLRGGDVSRTPVMLAFAIVSTERVSLFVDSAKLPAEVVASLQDADVEIFGYGAMAEAVQQLAFAGHRLWMDPKRTNFALYLAAGKAGPAVSVASPLAMMKACKNDAELAGMAAAHRRDAAALCSGLARVERLVTSGTTVTEVDVDVEVTARRAAQWGYIDNSFDTIAGYGANGAIVHYSAKAASAATVGTESLLLLDSGAQYVDGTTDVTRTMHFGNPSQEERECFTRVVQAHISLATATFPVDTPGFVVDAFARRPLWEAGMDYRHGTGHGVGAALGVHEGPQYIGQRFDNKTPLKSGMIISNEPGFYLEGHFGIRIENLCVVVNKATKHDPTGCSSLGFVPLTLIPIQTRLLDLSLMTESELAYLNTYHARVRKEILPILQKQKEEEASAWLLRATEPVCGRAGGAAEVAQADH